jgi:hypothetical protein
MEESELLTTTQLLAQFQSPVQLTRSPLAEEPTLDPLSGAHQPSARLLSREELDALLRDQDSAVVEPAMEDSLAALGFLLYLEHSQGRGWKSDDLSFQWPFQPTTTQRGRRPLEDMDMGAFANLDYGQ